MDLSEARFGRTLVLGSVISADRGGLRGARPRALRPVRPRAERQRRHHPRARRHRRGRSDRRRQGPDPLVRRSRHRRTAGPDRRRAGRRPAFNESQDKITLSLEIYQNTTAYDILSTQIAAGDPPDIIGPVGFRGFYSYGDQLLDLQPFIDKNDYDVSGIDPKILAAYKEGFGGQVGIPFAIYPSFIYYNKDLFKEAGVPEPPHKVGEQYDGKDWTWETLTELAKKLTVDKAGNDATSAHVRQGRHRAVGLLHAVDRPARVGHPVRPGHSRRRRRHDGPGPGQLEGRLAVVLRRHVEGRLHPDRRREPLGAAEQRQRLPVRQRRDGLRPPLVHLLRLARRG